MPKVARKRGSGPKNPTLALGRDLPRLLMALRPTTGSFGGCQIGARRGDPWAWSRSSSQLTPSSAFGSASVLLLRFPMPERSSPARRLSPSSPPSRRRAMRPRCAQVAPWCLVIGDVVVPLKPHWTEPEVFSSARDRRQGRRSRRMGARPPRKQAVAVRAPPQAQLRSPQRRNPLVADKRSTAGVMRRLALVRHKVADAEEQLAAATWSSKQAELPDLLDAYAALSTALRCGRGEHHELGDGERDAQGVSMRMAI